jgi:hypothetical protein
MIVRCLIVSEYGMRLQLFPFVLLASAALAGDTNTFRAYERVNIFSPTIRTNVAGEAVRCIEPVLDPARAAIVTNGVPLGQLVTNLGPGWMSPASRASSIHWDFADGRELTVASPGGTTNGEWRASFTLDITTSSSVCHFWWTTNSKFCFTNGSSTK